ncbi:MAG: GAF domain-containing sensor histidine kinase [Anaerolineae bacterium]|nr:GAF domain-containing sensor histidine kinase [Anaerolineae bacterium]
MILNKMPPSFSDPLAEQDRDQLLQTVRRLLTEADALSSRIAAVSEIGIAINRTLDLDAILRVVGKQAKWLLDFDHLSVCLPMTDNPAWCVTTLFGPIEEEQVDLTQNSGIQLALQAGQPQLIRSGSTGHFLKAYPSQIIIPLIGDEIVLGTVNFATRKPEHYTQEDMRIGYLLALQLASAIRNARNFAELEAARDELRLRASELEARNKELDAYSHTIAHDLKSPLNSLMLKSELIKMKFGEVLGPEGIKFVDGIKEGGFRMNAMIDQLLWLARLRNVHEALTPLEVKPVVQMAIARFDSLIAEEKITVEYGETFPTVLGHAQWVEEIFANLISNAIKYMGKENHQPRITIRGQAQGETVRYEVEDTGVGITPEDQKRLFEMFTRLHTVKAEGLGLGLSIVQRMVAKQNGQIGVTSQPGAGSTFWFTLPAAPPTSEPVPTSSNEQGQPVI